MRPVSLDALFERLTFAPARTPASRPDELASAFPEVSSYRDGGIFVGHFAGKSEWERHPEVEEDVKLLTVTPQPTDHAVTLEA